MNHSVYQLKQAWAGLSAKRGFFVTVVTTFGITLGALLCVLTLAYVVIAKTLPYPGQDKSYQLDANILIILAFTANHQFSTDSLFKMKLSNTKVYFADVFLKQAEFVD